MAVFSEVKKNLTRLGTDYIALYIVLHPDPKILVKETMTALFSPNIMVLSGMSNIEQMRDNISFMKDFRSLNEKGQEAVKQVTEVFSHLPIRELLKQAAAEFE